MLEVQSLRHHLRAHEQVGLARLEVANDVFVGRARLRRVEVHASDVCRWEQLRHGFFNALRAVANVAQVRVAAVGALAWNVVARAAIVANQAVALLMECERHVAGLAARRPSAGTAFEHGSVAPSVEKENGLFAAVDGRSHLLDEARRERRFHEFFAAQFLHVLHHDFRHVHPAEALHER